VTTETLRRWDAKGVLRVVQTPHDKRRVPLSEIWRLHGRGPGVVRPRVVCLYARVSCRERKAKGDLDRQLAYLQSHLPQVVFERMSRLRMSAPASPTSARVLCISWIWPAGARWPMSSSPSRIGSPASGSGIRSSTTPRSACRQPARGTGTDPHRPEALPAQ